MLRKVVVASSHSATGRAIVAIGASAILALRGDRVGLLRVGHSHARDSEFTPPTWQPGEALGANTRSWRYCGEPEVDLTLADLALGVDFNRAELGKVLAEALTPIFEVADRWMCEWRIPLEYLEPMISEQFDEIWCLHPVFEVPSASGMGGKWINIPLIPAHAMEFPDFGVVLEQDARALSDQAPFVFALPGSQNAVAVAELIQERCRP